MPGARLELARDFKVPTDFKSVVSADSTIRALNLTLARKGGSDCPDHLGKFQFSQGCRFHHPGKKTTLKIYGWIGLS